MNKTSILIVALFTINLTLLGLGIRASNIAHEAAEAGKEANKIQRSLLEIAENLTQVNKACVVALQLTSRPEWHVVDLQTVAPDNHSGPNHYVFVDMTPTIMGKLENIPGRKVRFTFRIDSGVHPETARNVTDLVYVEPVD